MPNEAATRYAEFRQRGGVIDLSARTQLIFSGPDRVRYLNGQVTNDVRKLRPGQAQMACVTTAKGKLSAEICVTALEDTLMVDAEPSLREALLARLERYVVADDVTITDATGAQELWHYMGPSAPVVPASARVVPIRRLGREGWDVRWPANGGAAAHEAFLTGQVILDEALAETVRIEAGIPRWGAELDENTLPPEAGLEDTHIDYHKGCYIGQEVISRLRSVGHVNRQLTGFVAEDAGATLVPGTPLFAPESAPDATPCGLLNSVAFSFALEKPIALGYLKRGSPTGVLAARLADAASAVVLVTPRELPFVS